MHFIHSEPLSQTKKSHIGSTRYGLAHYRNCTDTSIEKANGDVYIGDWASEYVEFSYSIEHNENAATAHDVIEWRKSIFFNNKCIGIDSIGWILSFVARTACNFAQLIVRLYENGIDRHVHKWMYCWRSSQSWIVHVRSVQLGRIEIKSSPFIHANVDVCISICSMTLRSVGLQWKISIECAEH